MIIPYGFNLEGLPNLLCVLLILVRNAFPAQVTEEALFGRKDLFSETVCGLHALIWIHTFAKQKWEHFRVIVSPTYSEIMMLFLCHAVNKLVQTVRRWRL